MMCIDMKMKIEAREKVDLYAWRPPPPLMSKLDWPSDHFGDQV